MGRLTQAADYYQMFQTFWDTNLASWNFQDHPDFTYSCFSVTMYFGLQDHSRW